MSGSLSFLGDRGLNSVGRFGSTIAGSNLPAAPWCWRHSLIDERPPWARRRDEHQDVGDDLLGAIERDAADRAERSLSRHRGLWRGHSPPRAQEPPRGAAR